MPEPAVVYPEPFDPGDAPFILLRIPTEFETAEATEEVAGALVEKFERPVILLTDGSEISALTDEEMNRHGWYRKETAT